MFSYFIKTKKKSSDSQNTTVDTSQKVLDDATQRLDNLLSKIIDNTVDAKEFFSNALEKFYASRKNKNKTLDNLSQLFLTLKYGIPYLIQNKEIFAEIQMLIDQNLTDIIPSHWKNSIVLLNSRNEKILNGDLLNINHNQDNDSYAYLSNNLAKWLQWMDSVILDLNFIQETTEHFRNYLNSRNPSIGISNVELLQFPYLATDDVLMAKRMGEFYILLHCYENSVRRFIEKILYDEYGDTWWEQGATSPAKQMFESRKLTEDKNKWLSPRGASPLYYLDWGDLVKIIRKNETLFIPYIGSLKFIESRFEEIEKLRNIVAHNGHLPSDDDFQRVELAVKDWQKQIKS